MNGTLRKAFATATLVVMLGLAAACARAGEGFVTGIDGLPLMPGLVESAGEGMVFDAPSGRIVEAYASGAVARERVLEFYASTLPQLGWRRHSETKYSREEEVLRLELSNAGAELRLRFSLSPTAASRP